MESIKRMEEKTWYKCSLCGKEYDRSHEAEWCERNCLQKTCPHIETELDYNTDERVVIFKKCKACKYIVESRGLTFGELDLIMKAKILVE